MKNRILLLATMFLFHYAFSQHTFSIVAVDTATGEVGSAGATCLDSSGIVPQGARIISDLIPGRGAANSQATVCIPNTNLQNAIMWLGQGHSPQEVIDSLTANDDCIFGNVTTRQYGVVDFDSSGNARSAAYTGTNASAWAGHRNGYDYAAQGNILLGSRIVDSMEFRFNNTAGSLCDRLMSSLQGANVPGADTRCFIEDSVSSLSAFIRIAKPTDTAGNFWLDLYVHSLAPGHDPIDALQSVVDVWKSGNCSIVQSGFTASKDTVAKFQSVNFKDASQDVVYRIWDMGDGAMFTNNRIDFNYAYSQAGTMQVKLIGYTLGCYDTAVKTIIVTYPVSADRPDQPEGHQLEIIRDFYKDAVYIRARGMGTGLTLSFTDILGKRFVVPFSVQSGGDEAEFMFSTSLLPPGLYLVQVAGADGQRAAGKLLLNSR